MLHDRTYVEASRKLSERVIKDQTESTARIALMTRLVLSRDPHPQEAVLLEGLLSERIEVYRRDPEAATKLLAVGQSPVDADLDAAQVAAMADVALVVFNLSETLTRK